MIHSCCSMSHTQKGDVSPLGERAAGIAFFFHLESFASLSSSKQIGRFLPLLLGDVNYLSSKVTSQRPTYECIIFKHLLHFEWNKLNAF